MQIQHWSCDNFCEPRYSRVVRSVDDEGIKLDLSLDKHMESWVYIVPCVIAAMLVSSVGLIYMKLMKRNSTVDDEPHNPGLTKEDICERASEKSGKLEIFLLYCRDFDEHENVVKAFKRVLKESWKLNVRFAQDEEEKIFPDMASWLMNVTETSPNRRIIIVESQGGVLLERGLHRREVWQQKDLDCLDSIFINALQRIRTRPCDYTSVFVVRFPYTPESDVFQSVTPLRRYFLPTGLLDLYLDLFELRSPEPPERVFSEFRETATLRLIDPLEQLREEIIVATRKLIDKPGLITNAFHQIPLHDC